MGVFAAPPKTATNPIPASNGDGSAKIKDKAFPNVAPI